MRQKQKVYRLLSIPVAAFSEEFSETVGAIGLVFAAGETCTCQARLAVRASEALSVPRFVFVRHSSTGDHLQKLIIKSFEILRKRQYLV